MKTLTTAFVAGVAVCLAGLTWVSPAAAQDVPFKVYITELWQLDAGVDPGLGFMGDYYAKVTINGVEQNNSGACDDLALSSQRPSAYFTSARRSAGDDRKTSRVLPPLV